MNLEKNLHKYLNGTATDSEIESLKADSMYRDYFDIANTVAQLKAPTIDEASALRDILAKKEKKRIAKHLNPATAMLRVAAVIAVLLIGYLYISSLDTTIKTDIAQKENITLPDASEVILNANTEIKFSKKNWDEERNLHLDGEAFFKVSKGKTFRVETELGDVTVLGTQFNVFARDSYFNIHCYEGLVRVKFGEQSIELAAGNEAYIENNKLQLNTQSELREPVWLANESSFENATLGTVLYELKSQYPISINAPTQIHSKRFSGSFTHSNLEKALRAICTPMQLDFTIDGDQVRIYAQGEE